MNTLEPTSHINLRTASPPATPWMPLQCSMARPVSPQCRGSPGLDPHPFSSEFVDVCRSGLHSRRHLSMSSVLRFSSWSLTVLLKTLLVFARLFYGSISIRQDSKPDSIRPPDMTLANAYCGFVSFLTEIAFEDSNNCWYKMNMTIM